MDRKNVIAESETKQKVFVSSNAGIKFSDDNWARYYQWI